MEVFEQYAAIYNSMAIYENLMGFNLGDGVFKDWSQLAVAPNLKAAARDMKAYAAARQYRNIPIGYFAESMEASLGSLVEYLSCGDNSSEAIDFYAIKDSSFSLCAELISSSDYSLLASDLQNVSIPIIYSQDGCLANEPLNFSEQHVIFGSNFSSIISGTIIEHWREQDGEEGYGLVNYTTTGAASTPTTLKDYKNLKSQWDEVTWNSDPPSVITPPSCPSSSSGIWPINADATLPTITDLHFATIGKSVTATGTSISSSISTGSSSASNGGSGLSNGEKAGIGVGAACGAIFFLSLAFWFIHRRRQTSQGAPPAYAPVTELHGTAVADELPDNSRGEMPDNSKKELPGTSISHELSAVPIYEAGDGIRETGPG
ncbi:hypothetical protein N7456_009565 [Penicillium angulare]|uniref:1,3-beta-glucanosyltransferase n=1 Tax=Penicillium angulare TaxID=116970 RepID=A0A9W9K5D1_9EURO|nr:hypothetical protein N7456_009565 [Penicillium angulare]